MSLSLTFHTGTVFHCWNVSIGSSDVPIGISHDRITKNCPATGSLLSFYIYIYIYYRIYTLYIINKYVRMVRATLASSGKIRCTVRLETEARLFLYPAMCFCSALSKEQPRFFNHPFHPCWLSSFTLDTSLVLSFSLSIFPSASSCYVLISIYVVKSTSWKKYNCDSVVRIIVSLDVNSVSSLISEWNRGTFINVSLDFFTYHFFRKDPQDFRVLHIDRLSPTILFVASASSFSIKSFLYLLVTIFRDLSFLHFAIIRHLL